MPEDLYQTLGVSRQADKDEIQKAYRKLARKYHPDMNPGDKGAQEKFKRVQEAYDVLSDSQKRAAYDQYGADFEKIRQGGFRSAPGGATFEGLDIEQIFGGSGGREFKNGFSDFFEELLRSGAMGGGTATRQRRSAPPRQTAGETIRYELRIPLKKAITGGTHEFYLPLQERGEKIAVTIPPGVDTGAKMRLRGKGHPSPFGGPPGDLILTVHVDDHPSIRRVGRNLELTLPVTLREAALGGKVEVPTPKGTVTLTIPSGSSSGKRLRLKGQGVDDGKGPAGDLIVVLQIVLPSAIDDSARELIERFDELHPSEPRKKLHW